MAIENSPAQRILNECRILYKNLIQSQHLLENSKPEQQIAMASDDIAFNTLQTKIYALDLELKNTTADITQDERSRVEKWLIASAAIIDLKKENNAIAWELMELVCTVDLIFPGIDFENTELEMFEQLSEHIFTITNNERINAGNYFAALSLQANLHIRMERSFHPSHIAASQAETFEVHLFQIQCDQFKQSLKGTPHVDFEVLFHFYTTLQSFYLKKTKFICPSNKCLVEKIVRDVQDSIGCVIECQKRIERSQTRQLSMQQQDKANLKLLSKTLEAALKNASRQHRITIEETVQVVFSTISSKDKEQLFQSLSQILVDRKKMVKPIPDYLKTKPFCTWYICYECRLAAVQDVLSKTESPPFVVKRASAMIWRMKAAQNKMTISIPTLPDQNRLSTIWSGIQELYKFLFLIRSNASKAELTKGAQILEGLRTTKLVALLQIEENTPILVVYRLVFHFHHIYECKGLSLSFSLENVPELRLAAQRTVLELVIEGLENVLSNGISRIDKLLNFIEQLEMEDNDLVVELFKTSVPQFLNPQINTPDKLQCLQDFRANLKKEWNL